MEFNIAESNRLLPCLELFDWFPTAMIIEVYLYGGMEAASVFNERWKITGTKFRNLSRSCCVI